ncbi:hypothetical protein HUU53_03350 [Candidatus Micrarchaeota archaeon]|nr:hypothetical protein [Candidatus Micrarchaeota archaeon]
MNIPNIYENKNYKLLLLVPLVLMAVALGLFFFNGVPQGVDLRGGLLLTVFTTEGSVADFKAVFPEGEVRGFDSPTGKGFEIELPNDPTLEKAEASYLKLLELDRELVQAEISRDAGTGSVEEVSRLENQLNSEASAFFELVGFTGEAGSPHDKVTLADELFSKAKSDYRQELVSRVSQVASIESSSFKEVGSSLSKFFLSKTQEIIFWSFVLSAIVVFIVFRKLVPSFAVIFGAVADIVITLGAMSLFDIPLSLASVAALLMLIGFSLDTDVMLTVRVLKRKEGTPVQRAWDSLKTGFMMNVTTITAFGVLLLLSLFLQIPTYYQIGAVAVIGGIVDFIATWCGNAIIILWSLEGSVKK